MRGLRREGAVVLLLLAVVVVTRLGGLGLPLDNDTSANAYHARLIVEGEPLYGTHHPAHHLPGVYYGTALAFVLFGDAGLSIKLFLMPWVLLTVYLVYRLGRRLFDGATGIWAAVFCALLSAHVLLLGLSGETELWANLPRVAGVLLVAGSISPDRGSWRFFWVGILGAASIAFKAVYIAPLAVGGVALLADAWCRRREVGSTKRFFFRGTWMTLGLAVGLAAVASYWWRLGLFDRLWMVFTIGRDYVVYRTEGSTALAMLLIPLAGLWRVQPVLLLFSVIGIAGLVKSDDRDPRSGARRFVLVSWFLVSLLEAGITRTGFGHYCLLILPPLCLLAGAVFMRLFRWLRSIEVLSISISSRVKGRGPGDLRSTLVPVMVGLWRPIALAVLVSATLFVAYDWNLKLLRDWVRVETGWKDRDEFLARHWRHGYRHQVLDVASYIRAHTRPSDRIYSWSENTQVYYMSGRRCAAEFIWPIQAGYIEAGDEVVGPATRYVVEGMIEFGTMPPWLSEALDRDFVVETEIGDNRIHRRRNFPAPGA